MPTIATLGDGTDEYITADMCRRVEALSPEAALVVKWAIRMEGILHRIEEFPEHEPDYTRAVQRPTEAGRRGA